MLVQMAHRSWHIALFDHKADVNFGRALGNHANVHCSFGDRIEHAGRNARLPMNVFANQTNDGLLVLASDVGDLLQVIQ